MLIFWSFAFLLLAITLGVLLWPLLRRGHAAPAPDPDAAAIAVYRDQKRQLEEDCAAGTISPAERDAALSELARRVAEEVGEPSAAIVAAPVRRGAWPLAALLLVLIPIAAVLLYVRLGSPDSATPVADSGAQHELSDQQIVAMVDKLAQRLKERPDDAEGWRLLARSYAALERFPEAAAAYARADALIPDDASLLADYADALAMAQGRQLSGKPAQLIQRALTIDPKHRKALALAATAATDARDLDGALGYWRRLQAQLPADSGEGKQVAAVIAEIEAAKPRPASAGPSAAKPSLPEKPPAAQAASEPGAGATIGGRVDVSPALATKVALTDTVFIFARAVDGPRIPLAVLRIPAKELPREFTLDDSMGMAPGAKLSAAAQVVVEARVSKTGNAIPQSGDFFGSSQPLKPGAKSVHITIDQTVP